MNYLKNSLAMISRTLSIIFPTLLARGPSHIINGFLMVF